MPRDWEGEYRALSNALVGETGLSAIMEAEKHKTLRGVADALRRFPLPSQSATSEENYRRILSWLYGGRPDPASLIIDLEFSTK